MFWRKTALSIPASVWICTAALAVPPKLTLVQGTSSTNCAVKVRVLVDPMGATADVSQFTIRYKSSCMTFVNAVRGADVHSSSTVDFNTPPGNTSFPICGQPACTSCDTDFDSHVVVLVTPPSGQPYSGTGDKEIAVLNFTGAVGGSACKVEWDQSNPPGLKPTFIHLSTGDVFGTSLTFVPNANPPTCPGLNIVIPNPSVSGKIRYYAPLPQPNVNWVRNVQVCVSPPGPPTACGSSDVNGRYVVPAVIPGLATLTPTRATEATDPSSIGGGDIAKLVDFLAAAITLTPDQKMAADVDNSGGDPTVADLQKLRRYLVFDFSSCTICATWKFICDPQGTPSDAPCSITVPACDTLPKDLKGILRGDVDGSWPSRFKPGGDAIPLAFGTAQWNDLDLTLPVLADVGPEALETMIYSLQYDETAMEYLGTSVGEQTSSFDLALNPASPGLVHGLLSRNTSRTADHSGEILELHFRMRQAERSGAITFSRLFVNDREVGRVPEVEVGRGNSTETLPKAFGLRTSPNPFNPTTQIEYTIPVDAGDVPVSLRVVDLGGRLVRDLLQAQQGPGRYRATWNGRTDDGEPLASGVYLVQLRAGSLTATHKAVLLK